MMTLALVLACLQAPPQASFEDKLLSTLPEGAAAGDILFSPDGRQVTWRARMGNKSFVMVNQEKGPEFDQVLDAPRFGPDGRTVFYRGLASGKVCVVLGGKKEPGYDQVGTPVLSPDGRKLAYAACTGRTWLAVIGGQKYGGDLHHAGTPVFNSTGGSWAVPIRIPKNVGAGGIAGSTKEIMVVDGKRGPEFDKIEDAVFSPAGNAIAYRARIGINVGMNEQWTMVAGTSQGPSSHVLGPPRYTADGRLVYTSGTAAKQAVVVDGNRGEEYDSVSTPVLSPDGRSVAYVAFREGQCFVVVDGKRLESHPSVQDPVFSPDGRKVAYPAFKGGKWMMVAGEKPGDLFELLGPPSWSPDSMKVAHMAMRNNLYVMVVDGGRSELFEAVGPCAWNQDGTKVAHFARKQNKVHMVIQFNKSVETYDEVYGAPVFSPDGKKAAFGARMGNDLHWKVIALKD